MTITKISKARFTTDKDGRVIGKEEVVFDVESNARRRVDEIARANADAIAERVTRKMTDEYGEMEGLADAVRVVTFDQVRRDCLPAIRKQEETIARTALGIE
jgi:hypothetical protein